MRSLIGRLRGRNIGSGATISYSSLHLFCEITIYSMAITAMAMAPAAPKVERLDAAPLKSVGSGGEAVLDGITPPVPAGREADGPLVEVGLTVLMVELWETMMSEREAASVAEEIKEVTVEIWETRMVRVKVSVEEETMEFSGDASCAMARPRKPRKMARKLMNCILMMCLVFFGSCDRG